MIVEVTNAGFDNKGAHLMLAAILQKTREWDFVEETALSFRSGSRSQLAAAGCAAVVRVDPDRHPIAGPTIEMATQVLPRRILTSFNGVRDSDVDAILDASGFAVSDQWGPEATELRARQFQKWHQDGKRIVLLPQAFGPFEDPRIRTAARALFASVDLVCAREPESLHHIESLGIERMDVLVAPDFTNLVEPIPKSLPSGTVVVIPNKRMIDKTDRAQGRDYIGFLTACADTVISSGRPLRILVHESGDLELARSLGARAAGPVQIAAHEDPIEAKAFIGGASLVIGSRYHGLVSAMSQGVPAIGTSWSHKYAELFVDYECEDALWDISGGADVPDRLSAWLDNGTLDSRAKALHERSAALKLRTRAMWDIVEQALRSPVDDVDQSIGQVR